MIPLFHRGADTAHVILATLGGKYLDYHLKNHHKLLKSTTTSVRDWGHPLGR